MDIIDGKSWKSIMNESCKILLIMNNGCFKIAYGYYIMFFLKIMDG